MKKVEKKAEKNFWEELKKSGEPIIALAPMADVTDVAFRQLIAKYGKPDVVWTEFVSADGLVMAPDDNRDKTGLTSHQKLFKDLEYSEEERPIVAQLFSSKPEMIERGAKFVEELGFDGVDINMGCPVKVIGRQGCGAAMIKDPENAKAVIEAVKRGAPDLPVSVKTRMGYNKVEEFEEWISFLLKQDLACLTIHWRTQKEMSKVPAHWELAPRAVELRDKISPDTILLGNGDVTTLKEAEEKAHESGCDGVMIGRGIFGDPWCFNRKIDRDRDIPLEERLRVMLGHSKLFEELLPHKNFSIMKKHFKAYADGFPGAKDLRVKLMKTENSTEIKDILEEFLNKKD